MKVNWNPSAKHTQLLKFVDMKLNGDFDHSYIRMSSDAWTDSREITTQIYEMGHIKERKDGAFQRILIPVSSVPRAIIPAWVAEIKAKFNEVGATFHELLSTALTTRSITVLMFELDGVYYTVRSKILSEPNDLYPYTLAALLLECKEDQDLILRITNAIQTSSDLEYTKEEINLMHSVQFQARLQEMVGVFDDVMQLEFNDGRLSELRDNITQLQHKIESHNREIRDIQLKQFALKVLKEDNDVIQDLKDYLKDISEDILDISIENYSSANTVMYLTVKSYMFIPETDSDFFKPQAMGSTSHPLNRRPKATLITKAVMEQKIRVPITATYVIHIRRGRIERFRGDGGFRSEMRAPDTYNLISNAHIDRHDCFSNYRAMMIDAFNEHNFIALFETMRQCTGSINVFDDTVMEHIIESIEHYAGDILVKTDQGWTNMNVEEYVNENTPTE